MKRTILLTLVAIACLSQAIGQHLGIEALRNDYPLLMEKFSEKIQEQRADYFFVIDISGSMNKYKEIVIPALNEFFTSLQDGDYVNVIHFGGEAEVVNGCYGTIDRKKVQSLCSNTNQIYFDKKPSDPVLREKFWNYTDLNNAMHTLANEMHQLGLNNLKFIFIITDFEHDPPTSYRGKEDWVDTRQQLKNQQTNNNVNVITLQLPGNPTHLQQVRSCFPESFAYQSKVIADGSDLASWFTRLKNNIMQDRFRALVSETVKKATDTDLQLLPDVDINGNIDATITWKPNELFDSISISSFSVNDTNWKIHGFRLITITSPNAELFKCKLAYSKTSYLPTFHQLSSDFIVTTTYNETLMKEFGALLGDEAPTSPVATAKIDRVFFCHPWPLGWCVSIFALFVLYVIFIFFSLGQARRYRIRGTFYVTKDGEEITTRREVFNRTQIGIGRDGNFLLIPNCTWNVVIYEKTFSAIIPFLHLIRPSYKVRLKNGLSMTVANHRYRTGVSVSLARRGTVIVDNAYVIHWI